MEGLFTRIEPVVTLSVAGLSCSWNKTFFLITTAPTRKTLPNKQMIVLILFLPIRVSYWLVRKMTMLKYVGAADEPTGSMLGFIRIDDWLSKAIWVRERWYNCVIPPTVSGWCSWECRGGWNIFSFQNLPLLKIDTCSPKIHTSPLPLFFIFRVG